MQLGGDVCANNVFYAYPCGLDFADLVGRGDQVSRWWVMGGIRAVTCAVFFIAMKSKGNTGTLPCVPR